VLAPCSSSSIVSALDAPHVAAAVTPAVGEAVLQVLVADVLASAGVLELLDDLGLLVAVSVHGGLFGYSFLLSVFDDCLL